MRFTASHRNSFSTALTRENGPQSRDMSPRWLQVEASYHSSQACSYQRHRPKAVDGASFHVLLVYRPVPKLPNTELVRRKRGFIDA